MSNIIQLDIKRKQYDSCKHYNFWIDSEKAEVECRSCGEKLNPMWVLEQMSLRENRYQQEVKRYNKIIKLFEKKKRTKCQHCKKMTDVNVKLTGID